MRLCDTAKRIGSFLICVHIVFCGIAFSAAALEDVPLGESISAASDSLSDNLPPVASPGSLSESLPASLAASLPECKTAAQLRQLVAENEGSTVTLTGDIVVNTGCILEVQKPTIIDMGDYGITVTDGKSAGLTLSGPLRFVGEGTSQPLFSLQNSPEVDLPLYSNGYATITATGANATAVEAMSHLSLRGFDITATGENSVAVRAGGKAEFKESTIRAGGSGGTAIHSVRGVHVYDSDISAAGTAIISDEGRIFVDYANVSPTPANAEIVARYAVPYDVSYGYSLTRYGVCVSKEDKEPSLPEYIIYKFIDKDNRFNTEGIELPVEWGGFDFANATVGEYQISLTSDGIPQRFAAMEGLGATEIPLHIVDPAEPFLASATYLDGSTYQINFFQPIWEGELILRRSVDEGENWKEIGDGVIPWCAFVDDIEDEQVYWFRLEVIGGSMEGISNILEVWNDPVKHPGGDRGGDWDDDARLPQVTQPPSNQPPTESSTEPPASQPSTEPPTSQPSGTASDRGTRRGGDEDGDGDQAVPVFVPDAETPSVAEQAPGDTQTSHTDRTAGNADKPETDGSPPQTENSVPEQQNAAPLPNPEPKPVAVAPKQPPAPLPEPVPADSSRTWALVTGSVAACGAGGFAASHFLLRGRH